MNRFTGFCAATISTALVTTACLAVEEPAADVRTSSEWRFNVLLDDKPIGYHVFQLNQHDTYRSLRSEARFNVKILFITAYRYAHNSQERWQGECLDTIEARTDDNGKKTTVTGAQRDTLFSVAVSQHPDEVLAPCAMTFAYWNPVILNATRLLNPQTGEYVPVQITHLGSDSVTIRGAQQPAGRYRIIGRPKNGEPMQIDLWYSPAKSWLALESLTEGGRRLRYQIQ